MPTSVYCHLRLQKKEKNRYRFSPSFPPSGFPRNLVASIMCHVRHASSSPAAVVAGSPTSRGATASAAIGQHYSHRSSFSNSCLACFVICLLLNLEIHHAHCGGVISPTSSVNSSPTDPHLKSSSSIVTPMVLPSDAGNTSSIQVYE